MKSVNDCRRDRLCDLILEYVQEREGAKQFKADLLVVCRELEQHFSEELHETERIRIGL